MNRLVQYSLLFALALSMTVPIAAQELPDKILGYKVHGEVLKLANNRTSQTNMPYVVVGRPSVSDVSLGGVTLAIIGEREAAGHDGRVELMTFLDFRVNGVAVEVAEFNTPFSVSKRGKTVLPAPASVFLPTTNILNAALKEITESKDDWAVTGRVLVFGKFKKFGFSFKRVIPVDVTLKIPNPLRDLRSNHLSAYPAH